MPANISMPKYQIIALDMANRIYQGHFKVGEKVSGRTTLSSEYNVSPETIRKALKILEELEIVQITRGSGVVISSREKALEYIRHFSDIKSLKELEQDTKELMKQRAKLDEQLSETIDHIIDYTSKLRNTTPLSPIEIEVKDQCKYLGKTVGEINFWHHTGGTIAGIKRNNKLLISPGPYATLNQGDILLVIGDELVHERIKNFLYE